MRGDALSGVGKKLLSVGKEFAGAGPIHRRRLSDIPMRISVSGIRGKSTAVRWLHDVLSGRGYDTYAKVTGIEPMSIYNGTEHPIDRPEKVRLYENESQLRKFHPMDVAIFENQGIRGYTSRLVNEQFVRPHVVFLTNVRQDHLDTLGRNTLNIARSLARSVPAGSQVVCGEPNDRIRSYLEAELERRDASISYVSIPPEHEAIPAAEIVYGLDAVLDVVDEPPITDEVREAFIDRMRVTWQQIPQGRVYDAAAANDPRSTELVRRRLVADGAEVVQPLLYLRGDRRGRTAAFLRYLESLAERGDIEQARVVGPDAAVFERHASFPVVVHDEESESPTEVLDAALSEGWPVVMMANTVPAFMQELVAVVEARASEADESWPGLWHTLEPADTGPQRTA